VPSQADIIVDGRQPFYACDCAACRPDQFQCANTSRCIPGGWICDGIIDCGDMSDERNCSQ